MRTLKVGVSGDDVAAWEYFLRGRDSYWLEVDGKFTDDVAEATRHFQEQMGLTPLDGEVGPATLSAALKEGFDSGDGAAPEDPPAPSFQPLVSNAARAAVFGSFTYTPAPTDGNPEGIRVTGDWYGQNIVVVEIPQLQNVLGTAGHTKFLFHKLVADSVVKLFQAWESEGLLSHVKSWAGSYSARFIRGSRTVLSNHSYGSAFDINAGWNPLGAAPAAKGTAGSTRELVTVANSLHWYWGGHFPRRDGMHFEWVGPG